MKLKLLALAIFNFLILISVTMSPLSAQPRVIETVTHRFVEAQNGVWLGTGNGSVYTMSNVMVLVGANDTLVVDSHVTPMAARALLDALPALTDKPVRYLVNSHYHFDHAHGNQTFPAGVEIIGHEFTRQKLNGESSNVLEENTFRSFSDPVALTVSNLKRLAVAETNPDRRNQLQGRLKVQSEYLAAIAEVKPTPPNITLTDKMTLFQAVEGGTREIQLLHFGRAHTGGDVVIFLPREKVAFTGDMMLPGLPYMGDGHVDEWPDALEGLKSLDFDYWLPGHGPVMESKEPIGKLQSYLRDLWLKTGRVYREGVSWEQAAGRIDMTNHSANFPQISGAGVDPRAVRRMYQLLDQQR
ncbi:MAG TPA: hypothetical protein DEF79_08065 [Gammaproteobacteria bacterium]|nr:hypothetical protein [Gammaproteobacteria bacterium]